MNVKELQKILADFEVEFWVAPKGEDEKTRHITLHLAKLIGKIGTVMEKFEHGFQAEKDVIKKEVIPDLLYFALSLAETHEVDLEQAFLERLEMNKKED